MQSGERVSPPTSGVKYPTATALDISLVNGLEIFVFAIILAFALFNVPRMLAYIANNRSEAFQGYLLRSATESRTDHPDSPMTPQFKETGSLGYSMPTLKSAGPLYKQWHFPTHLSLRHPAAGFMQCRVLGNYTVSQASLMAGYTIAVFWTAFYESNPLAYPLRSGLLIASQIPLVYALATKNNIIGLLVGVGYEKSVQLNYLHRHVGRLMVIGANVHAIGYIYKWTLAGDISLLFAKSFVRWGLVSLVCFDLLGFFSIRYVRTKSYNLFFGTHIVGLFVALISTCRHQPACVPYVIAASVLYGIDHLARVIKTRFTTSTIRPIPEMGLTRIDIPSLRTGWRAGQHVRLRILSSAMGFGGMTEVHPFTISSATNTEVGLVLMCKSTGNWTSKLYQMAQTSVSSEQMPKPVTGVKVMVEGPYGGIGDTTVTNYSGAMFVVGGSGVTFALSAVQDLVLASDRSRTKVIDVVWSISDPVALTHFIPLFNSLVSQSIPAGVRISVFYTRATPISCQGLLLPPGITLLPGRPPIEQLLDRFVISVMSRGGVHGAFVGACGPPGLGEDVARAVWTHDVETKETIGGIRFHEEVFGW